MDAATGCGSMGDKIFPQIGQKQVDTKKAATHENNTKQKQ